MPDSVFVLFSISGLTALVLPFINRAKAKPKANFDETYVCHNVHKVQTEADACTTADVVGGMTSAASSRACDVASTSSGLP
jgi:hypothetical protein